MTSSPDAFPVNTWVWLKQPDYPWWPAMVLDPEQAGQELPAESDLVLLCGPSAAATLAFANSKDVEQIRPFLGEAADAALMADGKADESCAAAIAEMLAAVADVDSHSSAAEAMTTVTTEPASAVANASAFDHREPPLTQEGDDDGHPHENAAAVTSSAVSLDHLSESHTAHKNEKKHKKDRKDKKKAKSEKRKKRHRRHRSDGGNDASESDREEEAPSSDEEEDVDDDEDLFRRRSGASSSRPAPSKAPRHERQSQLEEYHMRKAPNADARAVAYAPQHDPTYFYRKVQSARRTATTSELIQCATALKEFAGKCLSGAATAAELEVAVLRVLGQLTTVNVTVQQLQSTGVGVAVGNLLRSFTPPVVQLAEGVLTYWFRSLPQTTQQQLSATEELDRASVDTCSDSGEREADLGRLGVNLFSCFTNEEINDAPAGVDVMSVCGALEEALEKNCDADAQLLVLSAFGDTNESGKALRRLMLEGKIDVDDVVRHTGDLPTLVRTRQRRPANIRFTLGSAGAIGSMGGGSPTSPYEVYSPIDDGSTGSPTFGSPTGRTSTALYTCPHCGGNDAYQSSYTVQAHENMPDILLCKRCGQTWNAAENQ